jgi:hypothetical protein
MDLRSAVYKFMDDGRDLLEKLHADDGTSLTAAELRMLKVQLYLLDHRVTEMEKAPREQKNSA